MMFSHIDLGWNLGSIGDMTKEAIEIAKLTKRKVSFEFNGVKVNITEHSNVVHVVEDTLLAVRRGQNAVFGTGW